MQFHITSRSLAISGCFLAAVLVASVRLHGHPGHDGNPGTIVTNAPVITPSGTNATPMPAGLLPLFVDPLPLPSPLAPASIVPSYTVPVATNITLTNVPQYDISMTQIVHQFHANLPIMPVFGYGGSYPGPTIEAVVNQPILVNWSNNLPTTYPYWLPVNTNIHGNENDGQKVRTVVHLHGGRTLPRYDGYPTNFFYAGESDLYYYTNLDPATPGRPCGITTMPWA